MACLQKARLLDAKTKSGMYMLEYTVQKPEEDEPRHFLSAVSLGYNGRCHSCCNSCPLVSAADVNKRKCSTLTMQVSTCLVPLSCKKCRLNDVCLCRYNRLYTLTAQTREADFGGTKSTLQQVLGSFKPPTPVI